MARCRTIKIGKIKKTPPANLRMCFPSRAIEGLDVNVTGRFWSQEDVKLLDGFIADDLKECALTLRLVDMKGIGQKFNPPRTGDSCKNAARNHGISTQGFDVKGRELNNKNSSLSWIQEDFTSLERIALKTDSTGARIHRANRKNSTDREAVGNEMVPVRTGNSCVAAMQ